ncbi:hypothetical protein CsatA_003090 [Cannabis sativa]
MYEMQLYKEYFKSHTEVFHNLSTHHSSLPKMENRWFFLNTLMLIFFILSCCSFPTQQQQQQQQHSDLNAFNNTSSPIRCLPHIKSALLQLKHELFSDKDLSYYSKMRFWKEGKDCCDWDGVTCSTKTRQLIGLDLTESSLKGPLTSNSSLFSFTQLQRLNLAYNDFSSSKIPSSFAQLSRLTHLNLSKSVFSGQVPSEIALLSNLISLDLSTDYYYDDDGNSIGDISLSYSTTTKLAQNMTKLEELHLDFVNLSSPLPKAMANLSSLISLSLQDCNLYGEFPQNIFHLPNIQVIDVSYNEKLYGFLPTNFHFGSKLKSLNLGFSSFFGRLPYSVKNLSRLSFLDLSDSNFNGQIPSALFEIPSLLYLDLRYNQFAGPLTIPHVSLSSQLMDLYLLGNKLTGQIPRSIFEMERLRTLDLSVNNLSGTIEMNMFSKLSQLQNLYLSHNSLSIVTNTTTNSTLIFKLNELGLASCNITEFPKFLKTQNKLQGLDLSKNKIEGNIPKWFFSIGAKTFYALNMSTNFITGWGEQGLKVLPQKVLSMLDLSYNRFRYPLPAVLPFSLDRLFISNNNISGKIHPFLCNLTTLESLDMSNNNLGGEILPCLGSISSLSWLKLSNNKLEGTIPSSLGNLTSLYYLDLSKNRLSGRIPQLENNSMFQNLRELQILDVSNNHLSGSIPQCLGSFNYKLEVVNMKKNNFSGKMPQKFLDGNRLVTLDLSHNQLEGMVPQSLSKCNKLEILNLGYNRLSGIFPFWLQNLASLQVLVLRSNKFSGPIWGQKKYTGFKNLQIVDLSFNHFSGTLSSDYFTNWSAIATIKTSSDKSRSIYMDENEDNYYQESVTVTNKGYEMEFVRILTIFSFIDLSNNNFHGEIPKSIGDLRSLIVLNLSSNNFEGHIPLLFGNLKQLESMDLSNNTLSGRIPQELATLTFLAYLNLSNNQLTGMIPQGTQMSTFPNSSFYGNEELCGFPLSKECESSDETRSTTLDHESEFLSGFSWKAVAIGYACGFLGGVLVGYLFSSKK